MLKRMILLFPSIFIAVLLISSCISKTEIQPGPETKEPAVVTAPFVLKPFHEEMQTEMRVIFEQADEIILGVYSGSHINEQIGLFHYFEDYKSLDKASLEWGPLMNVIFQVQAEELNPEIIKADEFKRLSELDKTGICWDLDEQTRYIYLVEGQKMLIFLQTGFDETRNESFRKLIDAYPVTPTCQAKEVFDLMIRDIMD